ncbi:MAG TPA: MarR family transcriptional regulator [Acidimicrobiales bacterium]|nr:MarR family transcriptional regulator [Acidimicrobiales bacterium]
MSRPALDDPDLRAWRDRTLYRLLLRASRAETTTTLERIHRLGFDDVSLVDTALLANLDTGGTIISALARRAGVSRQAAGQQVAALERAGYVHRKASESDGRAAVIVQTEKGLALLDAAIDVVAALEDEYTDHLGAERMALLKELLTDFLARVDPAGALGRN